MSRRSRYSDTLLVSDTAITSEGWIWQSKGCWNASRRDWHGPHSLFNFRAWIGRKVDQSFLDGLEARLIQADVGVVATGRIIDSVREAYADQTADEDLIAFVKEELKNLLEDPNAGVLAVAAKKPSVYLIAGVNGSGKTTSIAKLAQRLKDQGQSIVLGA